MIALALLPENKIEAAFAKLKTNISEPLQRRFQNYFEYYAHFWLNRVRPA